MLTMHSLAAALVLLTAQAAVGQQFPNKPIRILTGAAGGNADIALRPIGQTLSTSVGQPVIIDNRTVLGPETTAKAQPDGYTLMFDGGSFWVSPLLQPAAYDVTRDFSAVSSGITSPNLVLVHPSMPVSSMQELIALAKAKPGTLNYASSGVGGSSHLATELLKAMTNVNLVHVPYKGNGPGLIGLLGNEVQLMIAAAGPATPHLKSGKLKALAVTTAQPTVLFPGLPTVAASGVPGYEAGGIIGFFAPAKTPAPVLGRLSQEIVRALKQQDLRNQLLSSGMEAAGSTPEQFSAAVKLEMAKWGKVIKETGIKVQ